MTATTGTATMITGATTIAATAIIAVEQGGYA
jgi:hypothetical protein